ncbi:GNAT family N-acetyltransferase [Cupriavidus sp. GA3-3]|uniref:GNAT family N-acetyltransferase n=1 Tax=Cupriavidus sp. GA3-3 TaxID=1229514 RepID=UPI0009DB7A6F|nr:GNAT family N-acetyltransferase [Cupriavidus sp. GA3-3]
MSQTKPVPAITAESETRKAYRTICSENPQIAISSKDWWLDSVCQNGEWDAAIVMKNNKPIAALPYYTERRGPLIIQRMPKLTQSFQLWLNYPSNISEHNRIDFEMEAVREIVALLPKSHVVSFNIHHSLRNLLPFYWKGFSEAVRYTYVIDDIADLDGVFSRFNSAARNKIRKAEKIVKTRFTNDVSEFYAINKKTFDRQGMKMPYSFGFIERHDQALLERNARKIFTAVDDDNQIHSALYLTWDQKSSYVHMVGEDPKLRTSGAGIKLIWDAIQYTRNELKLNCLDFEGSMIQSVESVRRSCGGQQRTFSNISNRLFAALHMARGVFRQAK